MSTAILSVTYRISSELRSQATAGLVSTTVGDHVGIRGAVGSLFFFAGSCFSIRHRLVRSIPDDKTRGSHCSTGRQRFLSADANVFHFPIFGVRALRQLRSHPTATRTNGCAPIYSPRASASRAALAQPARTPAAPKAGAPPSQALSLSLRAPVIYSHLRPQMTRKS